MSHTALYRKYRPSSFDDVIGQDRAVAILRGSLQKGIAHAYLFVGPRGTGKTSVARIFARELGTESGDLYELDAATNTGIEDVREMKEWVITAPFASPYKVYIFDEVHMFSKSAFNGLLKMLEEPPAHVVFILATTELSKVPETVLSRCQRIDFVKPNRDTLARVITETARAEGHTIDRPAALALAHVADGSFRDAHGALQQVLSAIDAKNVSLETVERYAGAPNHALALEYLCALISGDRGAGFNALARAEEKQTEMRGFLDVAMQYLRLWMLRRYSPDTFKTHVEDVRPEELDAIDAATKAADGFKPSELLVRMIDARRQIHYTAISILPLELLLLDFLQEPNS